MHNYLRSIGFSKLRTKEQEEILLGSVVARPMTKKMVANKETYDNLYAEYSTEYAPGLGLKICGTLDDKENFHMDNYFPYLDGRFESTREMVYIDRKIGSLSFSGLCEDNRLGVSLIFQINNPAEIMGEGDTLEPSVSSVYLSGMSTEGVILLPTTNSDKVIDVQKGKDIKSFAKMIAEARAGEKEAVEKLTLAEIDTYMQIGNRVNNREDVFSIVETSLIPHGMEAELYKIVGIILQVDYYENKILAEKIIRMKLLCNGMIFDVCINEADLVGEAVAGRRFRGVIWLQGRVSRKTR